MTTGTHMDSNWLNENYPALVKLAAVLLARERLAGQLDPHDLVHDISISLMNKKKYRERPFVFFIIALQNKIRNELRRRRYRISGGMEYHRMIRPDSRSVMDMLEIDERGQELERKLSEADSKLLLAYFHNASIEELAEIVGRKNVRNPKMAIWRRLKAISMKHGITFPYPKRGVPKKRRSRQK